MQTRFSELALMTARLAHEQEKMLIDGRRLIIKEAEETEANELISFISAVCGESKFFTFDPGEFTIRNIDEIKLIREFRKSNYQAILIGRIQNEIVGHLAFRSGLLQRLRHDLVGIAITIIGNDDVRVFILTELA